MCYSLWYNTPTMLRSLESSETPVPIYWTHGTYRLNTVWVELNKETETVHAVQKVQFTLEQATKAQRGVEV